jgi:hypothetical protein
LCQKQFFHEVNAKNMMQNGILQFSHKLDHIGWPIPSTKEYSHIYFRPFK